MSPVHYASNMWAAFSFIEVFFSERFLFVREYSDEWFSPHIGNEKIIWIKVDRFFKGWRAVMFVHAWFGELCSAGIDFFQAVVEGRI